MELSCTSINTEEASISDYGNSFFLTFYPKFIITNVKFPSNTLIHGSILHKNSTPRRFVAVSSQINERGEPSASYRWTGWVWEMTGSNSRL